MKSKFLLIALGLFSMVACKKEVVSNGSNNGQPAIVPATSVPQDVLTAFNTSFSSATEVEWRHSSSIFECQFNFEDSRHEASYDDNGHQSSHSIICLDAPVPGSVLDAFRQGYPDDKVYEWKLTNEGTWKAHFMRSSVKWEATFSASGNLIKVEHD